MSKQQEEDLPEPPPDYPRSYRKAITKGKYAGSRIECTLCMTALKPEKIDRHENGESKLHNRRLAERYAREQQRKREREQERKRKLEQEEQGRREREQKRQREEELEREQERERQRQRKRQIEAERKRDVEALDRELEEQNSSDEAIEVFSTSSSSSSSSLSAGGSDAKSSSDDDSDVQFVPPPSKALTNPPTSRKKPKKLKGISKRKKDGMWQSQLSVAGRNRHIGIFRTPEAAAAAYQAVRKALDESGLPPKDSGRLALFESARAKAKGEDAKTTNVSGA